MKCLKFSFGVYWHQCDILCRAIVCIWHFLQLILKLLILFWTMNMCMLWVVNWACAHFQLSMCMLPNEHARASSWVCACLHLSMCTTTLEHVHTFTRTGVHFISVEHMLIPHNCTNIVYEMFTSDEKSGITLVASDIFEWSFLAFLGGIFISGDADHPHLFLTFSF